MRRSLATIDAAEKTRPQIAGYREGSCYTGYTAHMLRLNCLTKMRKRVAVIGAGAAGLCALRHLAAKPELFDPIAYEQSDVIGGVWVYSDAVGIDSNGRKVYSALYKNLITNIPKDIMGFKDFPFPDDLPSFFRHEHVRQYLEDFADNFDLKKYIKFNSQVTEIYPPGRTDDTSKWVIYTNNDASDGAKSAERFDAVFVTVGQYSVPRTPNIPGMDKFQGQIVHSYNYRVPDPYIGKRVLVLGASISGKDISQELATVATSVILSHYHKRLNCAYWGDKIRQSQGVERLTETSAITSDGEEFEIDVLMLCTGYMKTFPFLTPECKLQVDNGSRVYPLYKHILHAEFPSLAFIGYCVAIVPFTLFECQVQFALSALAGTFVLPSSEAMLADIEDDFQRRLAAGMPPRYAHVLGKRLKEYQDDLADIAGFPKVSKNFYDLWSAIINLVISGYNYKDIDFNISGENFSECLERRVQQVYQST